STADTFVGSSSPIAAIIMNINRLKDIRCCYYLSYTIYNAPTPILLPCAKQKPPPIWAAVMLGFSFIVSLCGWARW
ncbi:MAG: hypothetical protein J6V98_08470, partial [Bacteroidales bacterium]|nr:hypothetical protein [Bacteroidales bacterium]